MNIIRKWLLRRKERKAKKKRENEQLRNQVLEDVKRHVIRVDGKQAFQDLLDRINNN